MIRRLALPLLLAGLILVACSPETSYLGVYAKAGSTTDFTEFKADGTFVVKERGTRTTGTYTVKGNKITLVAVIGGRRYPVTGTLEPGKVIDDQGETWIKTTAAPTGGTGSQ